jgi:amidohydrolase
MATATVPARIRAGVRAERERMLEVGRFLHEHPELGFQENLAVQRITALLREMGCEIQAPYGGLQTAFRAVLRGKGRGPAIGVLAEYDALAGIGHACGHNLITIAALAAAAGMAGCRDAWPGRFEVIGTPGEEMLAGKCVMARAGAFDHLDACFLSHPWSRSRIGAGSNALKSFTARFRGRAAHAAAAPQDGINALDAAILTFNALHALRQHLPEDARIHGIITDGGRALNVIPERAEVRVGIRSRDEAYLEVLRQRVVRACRAAARAVGAEVSIRWDRNWYRSLRINEPLDRALAEGFAAAGIRLEPAGATETRGSLDMGNVSRVVPAAHPLFSIFPHGRRPASAHTREFLNQAATAHARREALKAGTGMALTAARLLSDRTVLQQVRRAFRQAAPR